MVSIARPPGIEYVDVETAEELAAACDARFAACDVLLMAAAVADYRPEAAHAGKLKKDQTGEELNLLDSALLPHSPLPQDLALARVPDRQGLGGAHSRA